MNALLLTALSQPTSTTGLGALPSKKGADHSSAFADILQQQNDGLDPQLLQWLQALSPKEQQQLLQNLKQLGINTTLQEQIAAHFATTAPSTHSATLPSGAHALSTEASTQDKQAFIQSALFIANESKSLQTHSLISKTTGQDRFTTINPARDAQIDDVVALNPSVRHSPLGSAEHTLPLDSAYAPARPHQAGQDLDITKQPVIATPAHLSAATAQNANTLLTTDHSMLGSSIHVGDTVFTPALSYPSQATSSLTHYVLTTPFAHSAQWGVDFNKIIVQMGQQAHQQGHTQTAEIRLDPPELGPLRIVLSIQDNVANAMIYAAHNQTRLAVEQALPQLQQQLTQAGLSLGEANVSDQQFFAQSDQQQPESGSSQPAFPLATEEQSVENSDLLASDTATQRAQPNAIIDTFA